MSIRDNITKNTSWKTFGTITSGLSINNNLSSLAHAKEVMFQAHVKENVYVDILVPIDTLKNTTKTYRRAGYSYNDNDRVLVQAYVGGMFGQVAIYLNGTAQNGLEVKILYR